MDADKLRELADKGESLTVEFKRTLNDKGITEALVCLANASGGQLLLGVDDNGEIVGTPPLHGTATDPDRLAAMIANKTSPPLRVNVEVLDSDGKHIVAISVESARSVVSTTSGLYRRRVIDVHGRPNCVGLLPHEQLGRAAAIGAVDISVIPLPGATTNDLDANELAGFRRMASAQGDNVLGSLSDLDLLKALGFALPGGELAVGAVLLFGTESAIQRFVPTHESAFQVLNSHEVSINRIERRPLLRTMLDLTEAIGPYNPEEEFQDGFFRIGLPRFADTTLRELIANALVHRDYSQSGQIRVKLEDSVLEISSPGGFPSGITIENLLTAPPNPRNPRLADAFKRAGIVDRTGRGINKVYWSQLAVGRSAPDYGRSTSDWVVVRIHPGPADRELAAFVAAQQRQGEPISLSTLQLLHEVRHEGRITTHRAAELLRIRNDEARVVLNDLVGRGLLETRGEGKARTYHLSAAMYSSLGQPDQYVRTRGFDSIQQEQMIMTFVRNHDKITRSDAARLCQLSGDQASRLLRRLAKEGKLVMEGTRRSAQYREP
ncbi:MAG: putative DNA binding domain-containing protein [Microthrixaceae bacterium]|nr:putative DNA binding domain-containing protein [Microthrixaceae bacterium]